MPLFFQHHIDEDTKLAVWKINEEKAFFLAKVPLHREITHPHKQLQHLAGRYLLQHLFPHFPLTLILIADTRKPYLATEAYHFSISHCSTYAAAIVSKQRRVGVDVEVVGDKILQIQHKFISAEEMEKVNSEWSMMSELWKGDTEKLTLIWSCKEAVFKWFGSGDVDFKKHIVVQTIKQLGDNVFHTQICFKKETPVIVFLTTHFFDGLVLSYVAT